MCIGEQRSFKCQLDTLSLLINALQLNNSFRLYMVLPPRGSFLIVLKLNLASFPLNNEKIIIQRLQTVLSSFLEAVGFENKKKRLKLAILKNEKNFELCVNLF